jgi:hypothetical protein
MSKWGKLKNIGRIAIGIVGTIVPAVGKVEQIAEALPHLKGQDKQDAVVGLVAAALDASEDLTDRSLLNHGEVDAATRGVIDAVVHLHNVIEAAKAKPVAFVPATAAELGVLDHSGD